VRTWIEQWEMSLDDVDLELPEPLIEIDPDEQAGQIEGASPNFSEWVSWRFRSPPRLVKHDARKPSVSTIVHSVLDSVRRPAAMS
jgi:hypothetical protein